MAEVFVEQIIKRKTGVSNSILRLLAVIVAMFSTLLIPWFGMIGVTITILVVYGVYMVFSYTSVEYEYSFLNGDLTVDRILGQRKRKTVAEFNINQAEIIAPANSDEIISRKRNMRTIDFSSGIKSDKVCAMIINGEQGQAHILFEPDEIVIEAMRNTRPSIVKLPKNI